MLWETYEDKALFCTSIYEWFRNGRESLKNDESSGRLSANQIVEKIVDLLKQDRCMSMRLENNTGVNKSQVYRILTEDLKLQKVFARFVSHFLNNQKWIWVLHAQDIISATDNDSNFLKTIVTGDETYFQYESLNKAVRHYFRQILTETILIISKKDFRRSFLKRPL